MKSRKNNLLLAGTLNFVSAIMWFSVALLGMLNDYMLMGVVNIIFSIIFLCLSLFYFHQAGKE